MQKTPRTNQLSRTIEWGGLSEGAASGKPLSQSEERICASALFWRVLLGCVILLAGTRAAKAAVYSFTPDLQNVGTNVDKMDDLDHHRAYVWQLAGIRDVEYVSAKLTFTNINNWDLKKNALFIHLFNTDAEISGSFTLPGQPGPGGSTSSIAVMPGKTITSSVRYYNDNAGDDVISDYFDPTGAGNTPNDFFLAKYVDDYFYGTQGTTFNPGTLGETPSPYPTPNTYVNQRETYVLNFNAPQLAALNAFIGPETGTIGFGFDPDCHYFNSGITFELCDISPVPEASTVLPLVGVLLLAGGMRRFRKGVDSKALVTV